VPRFRDLLRYVQRDGWEPYGSRRADHYRFRKVLSDGRLVKTMVSRLLGKEIPRDLWPKIRKQQLGLDSDEAFWAKVR